MLRQKIGFQACEYFHMSGKTKLDQRKYFTLINVKHFIWNSSPFETLQENPKANNYFEIVNKTYI